MAKKKKPSLADKNKPKTGNGKGRPTKYSEALADEICYLISRSECGLYTLSNRYPNIVPCQRMLFDWLSKYPYFKENYEKARLLQAEYLVDEIVEIADDKTGDRLDTGLGTTVPNGANVQRSRLRVDARKWVASKLFPKKFSERMEIDQRIISEQPLFPDVILPKE